MGIPTMKHRLD